MSDITVSVNGVDNIGKSTQLAWLGRGVPGAHLVGTVDRWHPQWKEVAAHDFAEWWFATSTTAEHVGLMVGSHRLRREGSGTIALEDRGLPMILATCAATAAIKENMGCGEALRKVEDLAGEEPAFARRPELHVLLRRSADPRREAIEAVRREPQPADDRYRAYQLALAEIVGMQAEQGSYDVVLDIDNDPILDVQRRIRDALGGSGLPVTPLPSAPLRRLWVLAGLSESGKTTVGEVLRDEHGVTRLKIGYLLEIAALRTGVADPYVNWTATEQAEYMTEEVLRLLEATKSTSVSLESAHDFEATRHLRNVWGARCQVVYVDADLSDRLARTNESEASVIRRDATKRDRGAHEIVRIADRCLVNSGSLTGLKMTVTRMVSTTDSPRSTPGSIPPVTNGPWLTKATDHLRDGPVALVLGTGSTGTGGWIDGWSDLDLLVVRDSVSRAWLGDVVGCLAGPGTTKVAVSAFTVSDVEARRVPARVLVALRRAADGTGVLYRRADFVFHRPSQAEIDRASRADLGLVMMTTRRLLAMVSADVRPLYKHVVLLCKIILGGDFVVGQDSDDVLEMFGRLHPEARCVCPRLADLVLRRTDPVAAAQVAEAAESLLAHIDRLDLMGEQRCL